MIRFLTVGLIAFAGCYSPNVSNGQLKCSASGVCPEGFHCAADKTCWKNGQDPPAVVLDMTTSEDLSKPGDMEKPAKVDMAMPTDMAMLPPVTPHKGTSVLSGGVKATSQHYTVIMSTGQAPAGNGPASSTTKQVTSGVVGATQKR